MTIFCQRGPLKSNIFRSTHNFNFKFRMKNALNPTLSKLVQHNKVPLSPRSPRAFSYVRQFRWICKKNAFFHGFYMFFTPRFWSVLCVKPQSIWYRNEGEIFLFMLNFFGLDPQRVFRKNWCDTEMAWVVRPGAPSHRPVRRTSPLLFSMYTSIASCTPIFILHGVLHHFSIRTCKWFQCLMSKCLIWKWKMDLRLSSEYLWSRFITIL